MVNKDYTRFILRQIGLNHFYQALQLLYYLGVYVRSEQKKAEQNIWQESSERISEPICRIMLGIALKHSKKRISFDMKDETLFLLKNVIDKNQDFNLIKNYTDLIVKSIKDEQAMYSKNDWFSAGVVDQYQNIFEQLQNFQNNSYSFEDQKKNDLLQSIDKFISFRKLLATQISQLKKRLNEKNNTKIMCKFYNVS